ncbi:hypothetical protein [Nocardioides sp. J54]|uniref:hypothetical protein n=1 Tax=Nocardioides sp. J54 TaxID=935866 RepID=UPI00048FAF93|nr:hypothetical protein [Nocardioides sp. J54]
MSEHDARLADRVRTRGVLGPDDAARLLLPVADDLARLHRAGQAHGALSPDAVRVDAHGSAHLADRADVVPDPTYTPPDPTAGFRPHPAADDVWAFAAVLRFVTTGAAPGTGATVAGIVRDAGWLAPVTELAMAADPRERPSMGDVADYLRARVAPPAAAAPEGRARGGPLLVAGVVVAALALVGALLLVVGSGGDEPRRPAATPSRSADARDEETTSPPPDAGPTEEPVTAEELEAFARDYVDLASRDPDRGFEMLTRSYQRQSPRYREVWTAITNPQILAINPDPFAMTVGYTYRYELPGGSARTEDITLRLVERGGRLLIAGATAR